MEKICISLRYIGKYLESILYIIGGLLLLLYFSFIFSNDSEQNQPRIIDLVFNTVLILIPLWMLFKGYRMFQHESKTRIILPEKACHFPHLIALFATRKPPGMPNRQMPLSENKKQQIDHYLDVLEDFGLFNKRQKDNTYFHTLLEKEDLDDDEHDVSLGLFINAMVDAFKLAGENDKDYLTGIFYLPIKLDVPLFEYENILQNLTHISKGVLTISDIQIEDTSTEYHNMQGNIHFTESGIKHHLTYRQDPQFSSKYIDIKPLVKLNELLKEKEKDVLLAGMWIDESCYIICLENHKLDSLNKALNYKNNDWEEFIALEKAV